MLPRNSAASLNSMPHENQSPNLVSTATSDALRDEAQTSAATDRGFVLLTVLFGLAVVIALGMAISHAFRLDLMRHSHFSRAMEARYLADGLVQLAASRIPDPAFHARWTQTAADGVHINCRVKDANVAMELIDTAGLVDLNAAPDALLHRLLRGIGIEPTAAMKLVAAIRDFRDADDHPEPDGAESEAYIRAKRFHGPKNGLFESASEVDQVLGMSPPLYKRLRPLVTVHSRLAGIDPAVAPIPLLHALSNRTTDTEFDPGDLRDSFKSNFYALPVEHRVRATGRSFVIRARVSLKGGAVFEREAVAEISVRSQTGVKLLDWSQLTRASTDRLEARAEALLDCRSLLAHADEPALTPVLG